MQMKTDGLIIKETNVGESDRILTILTRDKGVISASARGARNIKSKLSGATQLLFYSRFTLFQGREKYIIDDAEPLKLFFGIRKDIEKLALAQYFAELCGFIAPREEMAEPYLRLALNALHMLETEKRPADIIKSAFEMRLLTLAGYMPDLVACKECGAYEDDTMYLLPQTGTLYCGNCIHNAGGTRCALSRGALAALRHTVYADFERLFSFSIPEAAQKELKTASEKYTLYQLERSFPTLDFYNGLYFT